MKLDYQLFMALLQDAYDSIYYECNLLPGRRCVNFDSIDNCTGCSVFKRAILSANHYIEKECNTSETEDVVK